ncbi:MAG: disulfide bond formation protein DsbA [Chromatiales bacterium]|jgi:2-hydroxychromene-2-carboxylate isomerase|nr:disulfide bond formation protein DsbA [Chromatiales bacterium]
MRIFHYFDYKSPYAYLAQAQTLALSAYPHVELELIPYTLDIPSYLGSAQVDDHNQVVEAQRNEHQWRRVRYSYMDVRREANRRGLLVRGPRKIFDSSLAHIAFLYVQARGNAIAFHNAVYERFWRRELDIEDVSVLSALMVELSIDASDFDEYLREEGRARHDALRRNAEDAGIFGVPSYQFDDQLYWGTERLERVIEQIEAQAP